MWGAVLSQVDDKAFCCDDEVVLVKLGVVVISLFTYDFTNITLTTLSWLELFVAWWTAQ